MVALFENLDLVENLLLYVLVLLLDELGVDLLDRHVLIALRVLPLEDLAVRAFSQAVSSVECKSTDLQIHL